MLVRCLLVVMCLAVMPAAVAQEAGSGDSPVHRAVVCSDVVDREPVGAGTAFSKDVDRVFCFTEIRDLEGATITHAWIHEGTTRARVELDVRSTRWRTWSYKDMRPEWTGRWQVKILDAEGIVLATQEFVLE